MLCACGCKQALHKTSRVSSILCAKHTAMELTLSFHSFVCSPSTHEPDVFLRAEGCAPPASSTCLRQSTPSIVSTTRSSSVGARRSRSDEDQRPLANERVGGACRLVARL